MFATKPSPFRSHVGVNSGAFPGGGCSYSVGDGYVTLYCGPNLFGHEKRTAGFVSARSN